MKTLLLSSVMAFALLGAAGGASAAECGDVTIASMNWQSAEVLANLDKIILNAGYGCNAEVVQGDTIPTLTSMTEKGQPDIAPEGWVDFMRDIMDKAVADGKLVYASKSLSDGGVQGWWIPKYLADAHPDIKTIDDVLNIWNFSRLLRTIRRVPSITGFLARAEPWQPRNSSRRTTRKNRASPW